MIKFSKIQIIIPKMKLFVFSLFFILANIKFFGERIFSFYNFPNLFAIFPFFCLFHGHGQEKANLCVVLLFSQCCVLVSMYFSLFVTWVLSPCTCMCKCRALECHLMYVLYMYVKLMTRGTVVSYVLRFYTFLHASENRGAEYQALITAVLWPLTDALEPKLCSE